MVAGADPKSRSRRRRQKKLGHRIICHAFINLSKFGVNRFNEILTAFQRNKASSINSVILGMVGCVIFQSGVQALPVVLANMSPDTAGCCYQHRDALSHKIVLGLAGQRWLGRVGSSGDNLELGNLLLDNQMKRISSNPSPLQPEANHTKAATESGSKKRPDGCFDDVTHGMMGMLGMGLGAMLGGSAFWLCCYAQALAVTNQ